MKYATTQELLNKDTLTYREILMIKKRMTGYSKSREQKKENEYEWRDEYLLTPEHTQKGLAWLLSKWKTPTGAIRKNNPFGYREESILETFDHFSFTGFYHNCTSYQESLGLHNLMPIWKVYDKEGYSFEYYGGGDKIDIVGQFVCPSLSARGRLQQAQYKEGKYMQIQKHQQFIMPKQYGQIERCIDCKKNFYIKDLLCYWPYSLEYRYVVCKKCHSKKRG